MNVTPNTSPVAEANTPATAPLTDEQITKLLALKHADGAYVVEADETQDEATPTVH